MTTLSTHVLDAALGRPARGVDVMLADAAGTFVAAATTDDDGRIAWADDVDPGAYALTFATGEWFAAADRATFFPSVVLVVSLGDTARPDDTARPGDDHVHVALLLSSYAYTTYQGS